MRDYAKVAPKFWTGDTGKALRGKGAEAVVVAVYLMTSPHSNMLGLYYQPKLFMAHETGLGFEGASKGLLAAIEVGFCQYDDQTETVWVPEMASYQIAEELKSGDKRCAGIQKDYEGLRENPFLSQFFDRYETPFNLARRRVPKPRGSHAPSMPLRSQEQEQEQEQKKEKLVLGNDTAGNVIGLPGIEPPAVAKQLRLKQIAEDAVAAYNAAAFTKANGGNCPNVTLVNDVRVSEVKRCIKTAQEICERMFQSTVIKPEFWTLYWETVDSDPFNSGREKPGNGHNNWTPDFEFLTRPTTMTKIVDKAVSNG